MRRGWASGLVLEAVCLFSALRLSVEATTREAAAFEVAARGVVTPDASQPTHEETRRSDAATATAGQGKPEDATSPTARRWRRWARLAAMTEIAHERGLSLVPTVMLNSFDDSRCSPDRRSSTSYFSEHANLGECTEVKGLDGDRTAYAQVSCDGETGSAEMCFFDADRGDDCKESTRCLKIQAEDAGLVARGMCFPAKVRAEGEPTRLQYFRYKHFSSITFPSCLKRGLPWYFYSLMVGALGFPCGAVIGYVIFMIRQQLPEKHKDEEGSRRPSLLSNASGRLSTASAPLIAEGAASTAPMF